MKKILNLLKYTESKSIYDLDDIAATEAHGKIIKKKPFLRKLYTNYYNQFLRKLNMEHNKTIIELGSGGGFIKEIIPEAITSDIKCLSNVDMCFPVEKIPFGNSTVDAFLMLFVFHHLNNPEISLAEMQRCLKKGGKIIMIEPANT